LNRYLCQRARSTADVSYLASPVTGSGVVVPRLHQLCMLAPQSSRKNADDLTKAVWTVLKSLGQSLRKDGQPLKTESENLAELGKHAASFQKRLSTYEALEVI
jgi:hypothetical protein